MKLFQEEMNQKELASIHFAKGGGDGGKEGEGKGGGRRRGQ